MRKKNFASVLVVGVLMLALSSQALAWWGQGPEKERESYKSRAFQQICRHLDLSDEQKKQFETRSEELKKEREAYHKEMREFEDKLKAEMQKDKPNRGNIHSLIRTTSKKRTEMHIKHMDSLLDLRENLTPEQKEKFEEMLEHKKGPRDFGRQKRPRR